MSIDSRCFLVIYIHNSTLDWLLQMAIVLTLMVIVTIYITMTFFLWRKRGKCSSTADLTGKTVIITGANTGIVHFNKLLERQLFLPSFFCSRDTEVCHNSPKLYL